MNKDLVDYALEYARKKGVAYVEARGHSASREQLAMKNGVLDAYLSSVDEGFCVRILDRGGLGFASSNRLTKDEARNIVDLAHKFALLAGRKDKITFADERGVGAKWRVAQRERIEDVAPEQKRGMLGFQRPVGLFLLRGRQ